MPLDPRVSRPRHATRAVRAGIDRDPAFGAVLPPLVLSSNFSFAGFGEKRRYDYTRSGNPTRDLFGEADGDPDHLAAAAVEGEPNQTPQPVPQPVEEPHPPEVPQPAPEPQPPSYPSEVPQPVEPAEVPPVIPERREAVVDVEEFSDDGDIRKEPRLF